MGGLILVGIVLFLALSRPTPPPPPEIAHDPLLMKGRERYLDRCVSCHGVAGKGDGPIAKGLQGPPPRDLTAAHWKHGDGAGEALNVITQGVKDSAMPGWKGTFNAEELRAVTAYLYYLAGRPVPDVLRTP